MEEGEESEGTKEFEVFGVHRLPLAPGTQSGYLGVRPNKSKKRPWQAWIHIKGEKRRCLGSFAKRREAAVARAAEVIAGGIICGGIGGAICMCLPLGGVNLSICGAIGTICG